MRTLFCFLFLMPLGLSAQQDWPDKVSALLNGMLEDTTQAVALHIVDGGAKHLFFSGIREEGDTLGVDSRTLFEIGSITKTFTTGLLMKAVSDGKLQLDDAAAQFFPEIENFPSYEGDTVRLRHLASHSSGFPRLPVNLADYIENPQQPYAHYDEAALLEGLRNTQLQSRPGEKVVYSNYGMGLLGFILTRVYQQPLEELYQENIAEPLGMEFLGLQVPEDMENYARAHNGSLRQVPYWNMQDALAGAGGLKANMSDLMRYLSAQLRPPSRSIDFILAKTHALQIEDVALGWHYIERNGLKLIWHNGATAGSTSFIGFDKEKQLGIILLFNTNVADSTWTPNFEALLALDILEMVLEGRE